MKMDVQKPKVYVGLKAKETNLSGEEMLKHELAVQIGLECLFGRASDFYTDVYESGLIDESYAYDFSLRKRLWLCINWIRFTRILINFVN